jgi:formamidopyrimidine-DNA glycosylase
MVLASRKVNLKAANVEKNAALVELGNASFQDILYHAAIHPKHKTAELNSEQHYTLFVAIKNVVPKRIGLIGKV